MKKLLILSSFLFLIKACTKEEICSPGNVLIGIYPSFYFCNDSLTGVKYDTLVWDTDPCMCLKTLAEKEKQYESIKETYRIKNNMLLLNAHLKHPARLSCKHN